jgi:hypothetical protein
MANPTMLFASARRAIGFLLEASPYSQPQTDLAVGSYKYKAFNIKYSTEVEEFKRAFVAGDLSQFSSIMGKRSGTISFSMLMAWGGLAATEPEFGKILQACGMKQLAYTTTGISWVPNAGYNAVPATIEVEEFQDGSSSPKSLFIQLRGCMGNVKFIMDKCGSPIQMDFEFKGAVQAIEDRASQIVPTGFDSSLPEAVLSSTMTAFAETLDCDKIEIDLGNQVELFTAPETPEGYSGARIVRRNPTISFDPYLALIADRGHWARITGGTTGAMSMTVGTHLAISAPAVQIIKGYDGGDRNGATVNSLSGILCRSAGNDELEILQGAKS